MSDRVDELFSRVRELQDGGHVLELVRVRMRRVARAARRREDGHGSGVAPCWPQREPRPGRESEVVGAAPRASGERKSGRLK